MQTLSCFALLTVAASAVAQSPDNLSDCLHWRCIGPYRGGRTVGIVGVPGKPRKIYMGVNNGGVWLTNDDGRTWQPIFDGQPTGSIGAVAVAPSNPSILYVGTGEGLQRPDLSVGNGVYKSTDEGKTWQNMGLRDGLQINSIIVDPHKPDRVFVAVLGHPYGPNDERGVYRTLDGGKNWERVLGHGPDLGAESLAFDPSDANTLYADLWAARLAPWEDGYWSGKGNGLYKSTDGGSTWSKLAGGLPTDQDGVGRIGFAVAPSRPERLYATVDSDKQGGIYRSEDGGAHWARVHTNPRVFGRGDDFAEVRVDPKNPDLVYAANTSTYRSTDGGVHFTAIKGSPGGDDYHTLWIDPTDSNAIALAGDQGACISVNGGETWSSWHNQPTAQFYHVTTDNQFPYWVYGGQQESGSAGVASRGPFGRITFREWHPVGIEEYGYAAPDPLDPSIIFGGKGSRYDSRTGQVQDVSPEAIRSGKYRSIRTMPLIFSTVDPHSLFLGLNVVLQTRNSGQSWQEISPDLTRKVAAPPAGSVFPTPAQRGVVYAIAPSYRDVRVIWAGTDDGLVHVTRDGGAHWTNVTPPDLTPWSKIAQIDSGRFDAATAYVAVNRIRLDDLRPYVYVTHDFGAHWRLATEGLPVDAPVNAVREDPVRAGLLYAATENTVNVSEDDGGHWRSLRLNLPATSVRDLVVHGDDLVIATHGRAFWILDDVAPLRQSRAAELLQPAVVIRLRGNVNSDTPLPPEEPAGENPADGAAIDYSLADSAKKVSIEILDAAGRTVRRYASTDPLLTVDPDTLDVPFHWLKTPTRLRTDAGVHRMFWDIRYTPLGPGNPYSFEVLDHQTPRSSDGPWAPPGTYQVRLTVDGRTSVRPLQVRMDPRVRATPADLQRQFDLSYLCYQKIVELRKRKANTPAMKKKLESLAEEFETLMDKIEGFDAAPTQTVEAAYRSLTQSVPNP